MEKVFYVDLYGDLRKKYGKKKDKDKPKLILTKCKQQASMIDFLQGQFVIPWKCMCGYV